MALPVLSRYSALCSLNSTLAAPSVSPRRPCSAPVAGSRPEHQVRAVAEFLPGRPQHGFERDARLAGSQVRTGLEQLRIRPAVQRRRDDERRAGQA
ncbi:hypothetical protein G6F56_014336 [Rhizopus delemar]|nr:hypothetical protein G6F56_014336 [Rhizopus delemar]